MGRPEEQEVCEISRLHAIGVVDAELDPTPEVLEEGLVGLSIVVTHILELGVNLLLDAAGYGAKLRVLLQGLAGDVERDVRAVHDAVHKVVVIRHEVRTLLLDEDVRTIERKALLVVLTVEVEGAPTGNEEQGVIRERALGMKADGASWIRPVVEGRLIELVVVLLLDLALALLPDGGHRI